MTQTFITDNKDFYPTPKELVYLMLDKLNLTSERKYISRTILEPSAGKGDIIINTYNYFIDNRLSLPSFDYIEKDQNIINLCKTNLREFNSNNRYNRIESTMVSTDFLAFNPVINYDIILMNPPFSEGANHLLHAIRIMKTNGGRIVCLLNAETIKNPFSNDRKLLLAEIEKYNGTVDYIDDAFSNAERKTNVETALVYLEIKAEFTEFKLDEMLKSHFNKIIDDARESELEEVIESNTSELSTISHEKDMYELVAEHDEEVNQMMMALYMAKKIPKMDKLSDIITDRRFDLDKYFDKYKKEIIEKYRKEYWNRFLLTDKIKKWSTTATENKIRSLVEEYQTLDFNISNCEFIVDILMSSFNDILMENINIWFSRFTREHYFNDKEMCKNIHMFNGWKTNNAYKVNKKVIYPFSSVAIVDSYHGALKKEFSSHTNLAGDLRDLEKTFGLCGVNKFPYNASLNDNEAFAKHKWSEYLNLSTDNNYEAFDDLIANDKNMAELVKRNFKSIDQIIDFWFGKDIRKNIDTGFFTLTFHKKGTLHINFKDESALRRFNYLACKGKGFLPEDYGKKAYDEMSSEEKEVVDSYEGQATYEENRVDYIKLGSSGITNNFLRLN